MLFDPNIDFNAQTAQAQQARAYADLLRKQAMQTQMPQGQMVSGHFVTPHWTQYLSGIMDKLNAGWQDRVAANAEQSALGAQTQAAQQWRAGLPEATAAQPEVPFQAATPFGSRDVPQQDAVAGSPTVPYQPVPTATRLKHALAGLANPATAKEAMLWNQGMAEEATREDQQQSRREAQIAQLEARREEALRRSEDLRLTREQQAASRKEALQMQLQIAEMNNATRRDLAALSASTQRSIAEMRRGDSVGKSQERIEKQLPVLAERTKEINPLISAGQTLQNLFDTHEDKPIAGFGYVGKLPGQMLSAQGNANRAALKSFTNAIMRANAGLSQTIAEQQNVNLETLADGNYTEKEIRKVWPILREKANDALKGITAGFDPEAVEIYKSRGGLVSPITPKKKATVAPTGGWKIEEAK